MQPEIKSNEASKHSLQQRFDYYINSDHADPLDIGLLMELRAHLKAANKGAEFYQGLAQDRIIKYFDLDKQLKALEGKQDADV